MTLVEYPDTDLMILGLADRLASDLRMALETKERVLFIVPGGTTPGPIFDTLSAVDMDWERVTVVPSDERWVDERHDRSNARLIRERLLTGKAAGARLVSIYREGLAPEAAVGQVSEMLAPELPIDVCLLGMGGDMHTASLFPGAPGLEAALAPDAPVLNVLKPEDQPDVRVSLSARALREAVVSYVVITGAAKREAVEKARHMRPEVAPVATVLDRAEVHWAE